MEDVICVERDELTYFKGDELAASAWREKYAKENESNPDDMHRRMAEEFARIEKKYIKEEYDRFGNFTKVMDLSKYGRTRKELSYKAIFRLFEGFRYICPQGSIMSMLGSEKIASLSNCLVVGQPHDSYGGILQKDQELAQLMKRRCGVGIDISTLRPEGTTVTNAAGSSTGAVSFMHRFSNTTREVAQNGRRGALMITIDVRHPDVFDFVNIKKDLTKVTGANISVMLRDDFMEAVKNDEDYILRFPCDVPMHIDSGCAPEIMPYDQLCDGALGKYKRIKAKELYDSIVENAHENAEPGQMFIDRHHNYSPDGVYEQYRGVTTNPCGEIFMQEYDACRLMAINLLSFVDNPYTNEASVDWVKLYEMSYEQQRLADDLVDLELEHISRILAKVHSDDQPESVKAAEIALWENVYDTASAGRRTGCGITALGDMLAALDIKYDSSAAIDFVEKIFKTKMEGELDCSIDLSILRGSFKGWDAEVEFNDCTDGMFTGKNEFYDLIAQTYPEIAHRMCDHGRRNVSWSTSAPTGTLSLLCQTSSGIEPVFALYYMRRKKSNVGDRVDFTDENGDEWTEYPVLHPQFKEWINKQGYLLFDNWEELQIIGIKEDDYKFLFENSPWYGSCAPDIDWKKRVELQAVIQKYTSHSISSTINLPENVSKETVGEIYQYAHEKGLKGVTVYREGSRSGVLIRDAEKKGDEFKHNDAPKRPICLPCEIHNTVSKSVKWNVFVGLYDGQPYEVFAIPYETARTVGQICKRKRGVYDVLDEDGKVVLEHISSKIHTETEAVLTRLLSASLRHGADITFLVEQLNKTHGDVTSFSKAVARTLKKYINEEKTAARATCSECGSDSIVFEEGCMSCKNCGSSKCG